MDELSTMVGSNRNMVQRFINDMVGNTDDSTNQLKPLMPESTLHWISKMIMKEAVEDKKMEVTQFGMQILENDADVLSLFDTSELYGLLNDGINNTITVTQHKELQMTCLVTQMFLPRSTVVTKRHIRNKKKSMT